jgi:hypothetical protein
LALLSKAHDILKIPVNAPFQPDEPELEVSDQLAHAHG